MSDDHHKHDRRHDDHWRIKMEEDVSNLTGKVAGMESEIRGLSNSIKNLGQTVMSSIDEQRRNTRTPWGVIFSGIGVLVMIVGGIIGALGSGYVRDLDGLETAITKIQSNRVSWEDPVQNEAIKEVRAQLANLSSTLQREMGALDKAAKSNIEALDQRFQREIALLTKAKSHKIEQAMGIITEIQEWVLNHEGDVGRINAAQSERINGLERVLYCDKKKLGGLNG